jgi:hypothetical protein
MASTTYTAAQLYGNNGEGTSSINLSASVQYVFSIDSSLGSAYFTMETVRDYVGVTPKNTSGSYVTVGVANKVISDYIAGFSTTQSPYNSFVFTPATNITGSTLKLRGTGGVTLSIFNPLSLFAAGEKGVWFDPTDISTLFQDSAGTIPVTTVGQKVGKILDKSGNGNHATQSSAALQPTYQIDNEGNPNLTFSGSYTQLVTRPIDFTATAQMMVGVGLNVVGSASAAVALELGSDVNSVNGSFLIGAPSSVSDHSLYIRGTAPTIRAAVNNVSDGDDIILGLFDISQTVSGSQLIPRLNRVQLSGSNITWTPSNTATGVGTFGNLPLYIGARSGGQNPFQGKIYQVIVRGALTNASDIVATENLIDAKLD